MSTSLIASLVGPHPSNWCSPMTQDLISVANFPECGFACNSDTIRVIAGNHSGLIQFLCKVTTYPSYIDQCYSSCLILFANIP